MLSVALALPSSLLLIWIGKAAFGVNVGDSDASFVLILGCSVLANACIVWMMFVMLSRQR
jgi:hypothetical protein